MGFYGSKNNPKRNDDDEEDDEQPQRPSLGAFVAKGNDSDKDDKGKPGAPPPKSNPFQTGATSGGNQPNNPFGAKPSTGDAKPNPFAKAAPKDDDKPAEPAKPNPFAPKPAAPATEAPKPTSPFASKQAAGSPFAKPAPKDDDKPAEPPKPNPFAPKPAEPAKPNPFAPKPAASEDKPAEPAKANPFAPKPAAPAAEAQKPNPFAPKPADPPKTENKSGGFPAFTPSGGKPADKPDPKDSKETAPTSGGTKPFSAPFGKSADADKAKEPDSKDKKDAKPDEKEEDKRPGGVFGAVGGIFGRRGAEPEKPADKPDPKAPAAKVDDKKEDPPKPAGGLFGRLGIGGGAKAEPAADPKAEAKPDDKSKTASKPSGSAPPSPPPGAKPTANPFGAKPAPAEPAKPAAANPFAPKPTTPPASPEPAKPASANPFAPKPTTPPASPEPAKPASANPFGAKPAAPAPAEPAKPASANPFAPKPGTSAPPPKADSKGSKPKETPPPATPVAGAGGVLGSIRGIFSRGQAPAPAPDKDAKATPASKAGSKPMPTAAAVAAGAVGAGKKVPAAGAPPARVDGKQAKPLDKKNANDVQVKRTFTRDQQLDVIGIALMIVGGIIFFGLLTPADPTGQNAFVTEIVVRVLGQLFGYGRYVLFIPCLIGGWWLLVRHFGDHPPVLDLSKTIGWVLVFITLVTTFHFAQMMWPPIPTLDLLAKESNIAASAMLGGGIVGHTLYMLMMRLAGDYATFVMLIGAWIISLLIAFEITLAEITDYARSVQLWFAGVRTGFREQSDRKTVERALRMEERAKMRALKEAESAAAKAALPAPAPQAALPAPAAKGRLSLAAPAPPPAETANLASPAPGAVTVAPTAAPPALLPPPADPKPASKPAGLGAIFTKPKPAEPTPPEPVKEAPPAQAPAPLAQASAPPPPPPTTAPEERQKPAGIGGLFSRPKSEPAKPTPVAQPTATTTPATPKNPFGAKPAAPAAPVVENKPADPAPAPEPAKPSGLFGAKNPFAPKPAATPATPPPPVVENKPPTPATIPEPPAQVGDTIKSGNTAPIPAQPPAATTATPPPTMAPATPKNPFGAKPSPSPATPAAEARPANPFAPKPSTPVVPPIVTTAAVASTALTPADPTPAPEDMKPATPKNPTIVPPSPVSKPAAAFRPIPKPGSKPSGAFVTDGESDDELEYEEVEEGMMIEASEPRALVINMNMPKADAPAAPPPEKRVSGDWELPDYQTLLERGSAQQADSDYLRDRARAIEETLQSFGAPARVVEINTGPVITQFGVEPDYLVSKQGKKTRVKVGAISKLDADLALALAAKTIRIEAPVPGKGYVGIEVPNSKTALVSLRDIMDEPVYRKIKSPLRVALGRSVDGTPIVADLTAMPHLLIAGTTGSGKSVCVNAIISTLLLENSPDELRMIMVDPKRVELTGYNGIPHLVDGMTVVVDLERITGVLKWVTREMEERYKKFAQVGARNIADFNTRHANTANPKLPYLVVIIDELADLMMLAPEETEKSLARLAQMARATGIHLIISTQRPSTDVVTGLIKANFPARISFAVASSVDSRVILDTVGAEKLLGRGDMLYQAPDAAAPTRVQGVYLSDTEITEIVNYWKQTKSKRTSTSNANLAPPNRAVMDVPGAADPVLSRAEKYGTAPTSTTSKPSPFTPASTASRPSGPPSSAPSRPSPFTAPSPSNTASKPGTPPPVGTTSKPSNPFAPKLFEKDPATPTIGNNGGGDEDDDTLYNEAVKIYRESGNKISMSILQRRLRVGYVRAERLIERMKERGLTIEKGSDLPEPVLEDEENQP
jgi:DNA segregation ATPase FtsK/SpoIIIE-like protein